WLRHRSFARCGLGPRRDRRNTGASCVRLRRCSCSWGAALDGVTIHIGHSRLSYACSRLREGNVKLAAYRIQLCRIHAPINHAIAVRADTFENADGVADGHALDHLQCRELRRTAGQAEYAARTTGLLCAHTSVDE